MQILKFFIILSLALATAPTTEPKPLRDWSDAEIIHHIDVLTESRDLQQLGRLADSLADLYLKDDSERYGRLVLRLCNELGTYNFKTRQQYTLADNIAMRAVGIYDKIPVENALGLAAHLRIDVLASQASNDHTFITKRAELARAWLSIYSRTMKQASLPIDPNFHPVINGGIAGFDDVIPGSDPSVIADPKRRAAYVAALAAKNQKAEQYLEHVEGVRLLKIYRPEFIGFIVGVYSLKPANMTELNQELAEFGIPIADQDEILRKIRERTTSTTTISPPEVEGGHS